jgi:hypothetical protein
MDFAAVIENPLGNRSFPGVDMGNDADVAYHLLVQTHGSPLKIIMNLG